MRQALRLGGAYAQHGKRPFEHRVGLLGRGGGRAHLSYAFVGHNGEQRSGAYLGTPGGCEPADGVVRWRE